ncbi:MAG TPA: COX15/CtaA family protein [Verrucomicrobiae bacterium]|jgi:cytochrome c oxidase assembly protein subunit 15|nr:COX15/CtaA family protein [Verrucomicrobiae bacterium]
MNNIEINRPLRWFAALTAVATFFLLAAGGLVTSNEAGMSVPDWPNSYGYNMFLFPPSKWIGGIFYEHTHRLWASGVGLMTTILAVWLWWKDSRKWMKWLGVAAFLLVVAQGVLGGLRVVLNMDNLGAVHGVVGQSFFVLMCAIALFTTEFWRKMTTEGKLNIPASLRVLVLTATALMFFQLILGATMRAQHAGLSINTFPSAYGKLWPDTSAAAITQYNAHRMDITNENPITAFQVILQMIHRIVALTIFGVVVLCAVQAWRKLGKSDVLTKFALFWLGLIVIQIGLGAATILTNKAADVATVHLLGGALSLVTGALWCIIAFARSAERPATQTESFGAFGTLAANK